MSTKITVAHSSKPETDFHLYQEVLDREGIYLELNGLSAAEFSASPNSITVRIPNIIWEVIRSNQSVDLTFVDWSDEEIEKYVQAETLKSHNQYIEAKEANNESLINLFKVMSNIDVEASFEEKVSAALAEYLELRDKQTSISRAIKELSNEH